jgi:hypothetical protein
MLFFYRHKRVICVEDRAKGSLYQKDIGLKRGIVQIPGQIGGLTRGLQKIQE